MQFTKNSIPICEIFNSISGEGSTVGEIVTFVRTSGCNLRCSYCDTKYSYEPQEFLTYEEVIKRINNYQNRKVIITGGEPLWGDNTKRGLATIIAEAGYEVFVETNGCVLLYSSYELKGLRNKIHYVVDYKCKSSGMNEYDMLEKNIHFLNDSDEIKFVLSDNYDFKCAIDIITKLNEEIAKKRITLLFGCVYGRLQPSTLIEILKRKNKWFEDLNLKIKLNLQIHKLIWDPDKRSV